MNKYANLKGQTFGNLTVISDGVCKNYFYYYDCLCKCGKIKRLRADGFVNGYVKSCGCLVKETAKMRGIKRRKENEFQIDNDVVYVKLTNADKEMICDIDDWDRLKEHCWIMGSDGYARTNKHIVDDILSNKFHQCVIGKRKGYVVDHINRNRLDNRKSNLRFVTPQTNVINSSISKNNTSGVTGVYRVTNTTRWRATIMVNRKNIWLGRFDCKEDAIKARKEAEEKFFKPLLN